MLVIFHWPQTYTIIDELEDLFEGQCCFHTNQIRKKKQVVQTYTYRWCVSYCEAFDGCRLHALVSATPSLCKKYISSSNRTNTLSSGLRNTETPPTYLRATFAYVGCHSIMLSLKVRECQDVRT